MINWETLIAERIEAHHLTRTSCRVDDPAKRNSNNAAKRWFKAHYDADPQFYLELSRKWKQEHPEACARHQKDYRARHRDDPVYKAKKAKWNRDYRLRKKEAA